MNWNKLTKKELIHICDSILGLGKDEIIKALDRLPKSSLRCFDCESITQKIKEDKDAH